MSDRSGKPAAPLGAVAFDFDGVILESAAIKQQAFVRLFAHRPDLEESIVAYHRRHLGLSRYQKLEWIHRELLGSPLSEEQLAERGREFSRVVLEQVVSCPLVGGAEELLAALAERAIPCFVVSGTPQEELELIVERRNLGRWFRELRGTPGIKADILRDLMRRYELKPEETLMVGDGLSDYEAARQAEVRFIRRRTAEQQELFRDLVVDEVRDLAELAERLARLPAATRRGPLEVSTG